MAEKHAISMLKTLVKECLLGQVKKCLRKPFNHNLNPGLTMTRLSKIFTCILIAALAVSSVTLVNIAHGQTSRPKPVVPEFTIRYIEQPYVVPATTTVDPYTGETVITHGSYWAENKSIEITIKNQPPYNDNFNNGLYKVQYKGHFENEKQWKTFYPKNEYADLGFISQKNGDYRIISVSFDDFPERGEIDFRVMSAIGYFEYSPRGIWSEYVVFNGEESDWSNVKTVNVGETAAPSNPAVTGWTPQNPISAGQSTWHVSIVFGFDWEKIAWLGTVGAIVVLATVLIAIWRIRKSSNQTTPA